MSALASHLKRFKDASGAVSIVALIDDLGAMRVIAVWPYVPKEWEAPREKPPMEPNALWRWLWEGCLYDEEQLADMAELPVRALERKMTRLAAARLIFPDGSVLQLAESFIRGVIKKEMPT